jgi:tetratricopeptide (TPR) repeat protein
VTHPFIGRTAEIARVYEAVKRACGGDGELVLLSGEPGIGKTRLADHATEMASKRGARVLWGRCWEAGGAPPYWPWIGVFRELSGDHPFEATAPGDPERARFQLFDHVVSNLKRAAADAPIAIVLDDLHAADIPSLRLLLFLARSLRKTRILVLGTYRDVEARLAPDVGDLLAKIAREGALLPLARLSALEVATWVKETRGDVSERLALEVHRATEGNPLFVGEVLRLGMLERLRIPDNLRAILREHTGRVGETAREVLRIASVLGREVERAELAPLSSLGPDALEAALGEAVAAGVLVPAGATRFAFAHILMQESLYAELAPTRRAELHWRVGEELDRKGELAKAAHHLLSGATAGDVDRAIAVAKRAGERAMEIVAFEDAVRVLEGALAATGAAEDARTAELLIALGEAQMRAGAVERGRDSCARAAEIAKKLGERSLMVRAALVYGTVLFTARIDPRMVALLRDALASLPPDPSAERARVMARLASALTPPMRGDVQEPLDLARDSVAMARELGDPDTLLYTLQYAASAVYYPAGSAQRTALGEELLARASSVGRKGVLLQVWPWRIADLYQQGAWSKGDENLRGYEALLSEVPVPYYQWRAPMCRSGRATLLGRFDEARALAKEALSIGERGDVFEARICFYFHQITLAWNTGDFTVFVEDTPHFLGFLSQMGFAGHPYRAIVLAAAGRRDEARDVFHRGLAEWVMESFPFAMMSTMACMMLRDTDAAANVYDRLLPHEEKNQVYWGPMGSGVAGPASTMLGDLSLLRGRRNEAIRHYERGVAFAERMQAPLFIDASRRKLAEAGAERAAPRSQASPKAALPSISLERDGDVWRLTTSTDVVHLKDAKGLAYLDRLLKSPGQDLHVTQLLDSDQPIDSGDAGEILDAKAKEIYRRKLEDLKEGARRSPPLLRSRPRAPRPGRNRCDRRAALAGGRPRGARPEGVVADRARAHQCAAQASRRHCANQRTISGSWPLPRGHRQDRDVLLVPPDVTVFHARERLFFEEANHGHRQQRPRPALRGRAERT